jgi:hypothetical protein
MPRAFFPRLLLVAAVSAVACGSDEAEPLAARARAAPRLAAVPEIPAVRFGARPAEGVPHSAAIRGIELAPDGSAALTRDATGGVRLWPALDGSAQPRVVPVRGALQMSLARRRDGGLLVALVDPAGEVRLLRADQSGHMALVDPPAGIARPAIGVRVLPGGERAVVLRDDHSLDLIDDGGARRARLEQRGFRPVAIAAAGSGVVALSLERDGASHRAVIHRLDIADRTMSLRPSTVEVIAPAGVSPSSWSVDPSGGVVAMLVMRPTSAFACVVVADLERGASEEVELPISRGEEVAIGFVDDRNLVVSGRPSVGSWRIDVTRKGAIYPAVTPDDRDNEMVSATARGTRATAVGSWLWVDAAGRDRVYLGYRPFLAEDVAISPDNRWVAWVSAGEIHMLGLRGQPPPRQQLPVPDPMVQYRRVFFLDDRRLLLLDTSGQIEMVDRASGQKLRSLDVGGVASDVHVDARRALMAVLRPGGQVWIYRVSAAGGFGGPLLVGDGATRVGFQDRDGNVLWTLDAANKLRTYSLADLERGMSRAEAIERGTPLPFNPREIDRQGRLFVQTTDLRRLKGSQADAVDRTFPMVGPVARILSSPDGARVAFVRADGLVSLFDGAREQPSWSRAFVDMAQNAAWSQDGSLLAVATHSGSAVLDASTGNFVHLTCGPLFEVRRTPPLNLVPPAPRISLCEAGAGSPAGR